MNRRSIGGRPASNIPRSTTATSNSSSGNVVRSGRPAIPDSEVYRFPILKFQAIISCMSDIQVTCTEDDLARPTPQKMTVVYDAFMSVAKGNINEDCTLEDILDMNLPLQSPPDMLLDSVRFYLFNQQMADLMLDLGVPNFTSRDVTKPEGERVRRILSAIINFGKFKGDRHGHFIRRLAESDELAFQVDENEILLDQMVMELEALRQQKQAQEPEIEECKIKNQEQVEELEEYKKQEVLVTRQKDDVSRERTDLVDRNKELNAAIERATAELNALQSQRVDVPDTLEQELQQIPESIQTLHVEVDQLRRDIQTQYSMVERMEFVPQELSTLLEMMNETATLQAKAQDDALDAESLRSKIVNKRVAAESLKPKLETQDRLMKNAEERSRAFRDSELQKRAIYEAQIDEQEKTLVETEEQLMESMRVLEEQQKKYTEVYQREEKWAEETSALMEQLRLQFQQYSNEILWTMQQM